MGIESPRSHFKPPEEQTSTAETKESDKKEERDENQKERPDVFLKDFARIMGNVARLEGLGQIVGALLRLANTGEFDSFGHGENRAYGKPAPGKKGQSRSEIRVPYEHRRYPPETLEKLQQYGIELPPYNSVGSVTVYAYTAFELIRGHLSLVEAGGNPDAELEQTVDVYRLFSEDSEVQKTLDELLLKNL